MKQELLSLTTLKYFCDAVRLGGLSAAAKENFVTQSAISQGISKLEKSLRISLLIHHPNKLQLTPQGEMAFQEALKVLQSIKQFHSNLLQDQSILTETLEFACTDSFALAVIPPYIKRFRQEHPDAKVNFSLGQSLNIIEQVKNGSVDFGILPLEICQNEQCQFYEEDLSRFEKQTIYSGSFQLYTSTKIKKSDQKNLGFILTPSLHKETVLLSESYYKKYGKKLTTILEVSNWELVARLVEEGLGIGYLPDYIGLKYKTLLELCDFGIQRQQYRISAIFLKGSDLRKSSKVFLSYFS
ncbi:MAG: LysR family transcriptional regulator [Verrucomicrobia bacterium]|nr:LysR family transcriptional regulator [Verrucomicrobiota bacterium]